MLDKIVKRIAVAAGKIPADVVIKNGKIIDVFNGEIMEGDLAIVDGYFAGIGHFEGNHIIDAENRFVSPTFIDGHVHIESSMLTPSEFAKVLLLHGVSAVIADPHEIANVLGIEGIQYMLNASEDLPFDFYFMLPSCVPATPFEHNGAKITADNLRPFYHHPRVLGLAEVMNFPAVLHADDDMLRKILDAYQSGKLIDGHAAGLFSKDLNVYLSAMIRTDHECTNIVDAKDRLKRGMYLMIREGTVAKDLKQIIGVVNERNMRRCLFVTDDKHLDDLLLEGSIDHCIRLAILHGISPISAIQMGTINAAECFRLKENGAIAPGYKADFILLDDLETIKIAEVYKSGKKVVENGKLVSFPEKQSIVNSFPFQNTVNFEEITENHLHLQLPHNEANIIGIIPNSLVTTHIKKSVTTCERNRFIPSIKNDELKLVVIERHHMTKLIGIGIVHGLGIKSGAIATTIAHDSHNLVISGTNDADMVIAANEIKEMNGGLIVVNDQKVLAKLPLDIAGLMSADSYEEVYLSILELHQALKKIGAPAHFNPFLTLSFLTLPVIPELKLTDSGLFQVSAFKHISV